MRRIDREVRVLRSVAVDSGMVEVVAPRFNESCKRNGNSS